MLDVLRKNSRHWLVTAIISLVIVGLAAFFGNSGKDAARGGSWAAKVDGETIKMGEFLNSYRMVVDNYRAKLGSSFDEKMLESMNIKSYILKNIVDERIAVKEAVNNGIGVSDEELKENIQAYPAFQQNGAFNMEYYKKLLSYNRIKPAEFEKMQRTGLLRQGLNRSISDSSKASDEEVMNAYRTEAEKVKLLYVSIDPASKTSGSISADEVNKFLQTESGKKETSDYYTNHSNEFAIPVKDAKPASVRMFNDVKEDIARNLLLKKKDAASYNAKIDVALKAGNIDSAAKLLGQKVQTTEAFSRTTNSIPGVAASNSNDVLWAFGMEKGKIYKRETGSKVYIVAVKEKTFSALDPKKKEFDDYKQKFLSERGKNELGGYMKELEKKWKSKVEYSPYLMNEIRGPKEGVL